MRLIDADALQENLKKAIKESKNLITAAQLTAVIEAEPKVYDADKVEEQLIDLKNASWSERLFEKETRYWEGYWDGVTEAYKIISNGGKEEK